MWVLPTGIHDGNGRFVGENPLPDQDIDDNIVNVCRCATYYRMRKAVHRAAELRNGTPEDRS